jgi:PAS domain S-box-containing protein
MEKQLRILLLEDCRDDADLLMLELHSAGIGHVLKVVSTRDDFIGALADFKPDLVLSDHSLPDCTGIEAMNLARQHTADLPFILVTGALGEELAVQTIKAGATDYILKNRLYQLAPAIMRAVREAEQRSQRRHAEQILRESEERFRQLAENIHEVFWMTDPARNELMYVSPGYERIWGRTCQSLYENRLDWIESVHPEDRERVCQAIPNQNRTGAYNEVYRILRPDGSLRWILDRAFPIHNEQGQVYRIAGIAEDITARKEAEQALRQAEANYRSIFENAIEGIFQTTPDGRYLSANPALARSLGYASPEEMIANISDIGSQVCVQPETRELLKRRLETDGYVRDFENQIFRRDGAKIWISVNAHVVRDSSGQIAYYEGTSQDITRRKLAEAQVAMLAHAVESTTEALCITDLEDRFIFVNRAFQNTYGYSEAEILGKTPAILFPKTILFL